VLLLGTALRIDVRAGSAVADDNQLTYLFSLQLLAEVDEKLIAVGCGI
jgi:hypothetical protein